MPDTKNPHRRAEITRVGKFGAVGLLNTLIDFAIYNVCGKFLHLAPVPSNIISTTVAMAFSFAANRRVVFGRHHGPVFRQAVTFLVATAVGLYLIQTSIIYLLVHVWPAPLELAVRIVRSMGIHVFADDFYIRNGAKAIATVFSLTWNYLVYKKVVFR